MSMKKYVNNYVEAMPPSGIRKFFDIASEMKNVISLSVGEPDFVTPWSVREAAIVGIERGMTHYTSNSGLTELREQICIYLKNRFNLDYKLEETFVTAGSSEGIDLAMRAILNPGDEVIVPAPSYVSYAPCVELAGGVAVVADLFEENNFVLTPADIEKAISAKTKAIILPFPNNPTGAIMTKEQLAEIVDYLKDKDIIIISDEIYAELTYGNVVHTSIASFPEVRDKVILLNGFSKAFAMTGWRVGYACGHKDIIDAMVKIHQYTMLCAPSISQVAAYEALKSNAENGYKTISEMVIQYDCRRQKLYKALQEMGLKTYEPKGAFYFFVNIKKTGLTSEEFCTRFVQEYGVAVVPGTAFGEMGEGYFRCCYAVSSKNIDIAIEKLQEFLKELGVN